MKAAWSELVERAKQNDQDAFFDLYQNSYDAIYRTVKSMMRDEDAALDVVQDTFVKGFASLSTLGDPEQFLPWMRRIATNKAKDWFKKKRETTFSQLADEDGNEPDFEDERTEHLPEEVLDRNETARLIEEILQTLSEEQRLVIGMYYYQNMTIPEIAQALEIGESAVKGRLHYGKKKIRACVEDLEKKGTKLYSLSPIPFLLWLFRNQMLQTSAGNAPVAAFGSIMAATSGTAATAATGTAAAGTASAATSAGGGVFATLGAKITAGVLAVTLVGGGIGAGVYLANRGGEESQPPAGSEAIVSAEESSAPEASEESTEEVSAAIAEELLTQYLEEQLIPEMGIYQFEQTAFYRDEIDDNYEYIYRKEYRYDPDAGDFTENEKSLIYDPDGVSSGEAQEYQTALDTLEDRDTSGLCCGDIYDYDGDGMPELLIVYKEDGNLSLGMFDVKDGRVETVKRMTLVNHSAYVTSRTDVCRQPAEDGKGCEILIRETNPKYTYWRFSSYSRYTWDLQRLSLMSVNWDIVYEDFNDENREAISLKRDDEGKLLHIPDAFAKYGHDDAINGRGEEALDRLDTDERKLLCTYYGIGARVNDFARKYYKGNSEPAADPEPVLSAEEVLMRHFEDVLIPEKGVYNFEQPSFTMGAQKSIDFCYCTYDPATGSFDSDVDVRVPWKEGYEELYAAYEAAKANADVSGLWFGKLFDCDRDGEPELLVIYGENGNVYFEIFKVAGEKAVSYAKLSITAYGPDFSYRYLSYRYASDGINYIIEDAVYSPKDGGPKKQIFYRLSRDLKPISTLVMDTYWMDGTYATETFYDGREERTVYIDIDNYDEVLADYGSISVGDSSGDAIGLYVFWETGGAGVHSKIPTISMLDYFVKYYYGADAG